MVALVTTGVDFCVKNVAYLGLEQQESLDAESDRVCIA